MSIKIYTGIIWEADLETVYRRALDFAPFVIEQGEIMMDRFVASYVKNAEDADSADAH